MLELAKQYAKLLKTSVLAHHEDGDTIVFVLASGPKLSMTKDELSLAIQKAAPAPSAEAKKEPTPAPTKTKKGKAK